MTALPVHREKNTVPFFRFSEDVSFCLPQPLSGFLRVCCVPGILLHTLVLQWTTVSVTVPGSHPLGKTTTLCVGRGGWGGRRGVWLKQKNLLSLSSGPDVWDQGVGKAALPPPSEGSRLLPALVASRVSWLVVVVDSFLLPVLTWSSLCPNLLFP